MRAVHTYQFMLHMHWQRVMDLIVRKPVQKPPSVDVLKLYFKYNIFVSSSRRSCHDVLIEGKWDEDNHNQQIHHCTNRAHRLRNLLLVHFTHILPLQSRLHERRAQPADHSIRRRKRNAAEGQRGDERLAIALESVGYDGNAREEQGQETQLLRQGEL